MPKVLADVVRMVQIVIEQLGMGGDRPTGGLRGVGVGDQIVRGRACRADSPEHAGVMTWDRNPHRREYARACDARSAFGARAFNVGIRTPADRHQVFSQQRRNSR